MKRHQDAMSDSPTPKQQKTVKQEEVPNSLLSLPKVVLQYCISFLGKGHYQFGAASVNKSTESMEMKIKT
jgi:hypothetical protein